MVFNKIFINDLLKIFFCNPFFSLYIIFCFSLKGYICVCVCTYIYVTYVTCMCI